MRLPSTDPLGSRPDVTWLRETSCVAALRLVPKKKPLYFGGRAFGEGNTDDLACGNRSTVPLPPSKMQGLDRKLNRRTAKSSDFTISDISKGRKFPALD